MAAYDNLVINPSGEQSFNIAWTASNGVVTTADLNAINSNDILISSDSSDTLYDSISETDTMVSSAARVSNITARTGTGLIRYEVTSQSGVGYRTTPSGPVETPHKGAFRINDINRSAAMLAYLASDTLLWVQPVVRLVTILNNSIVEGVSLPFGAPVQLTGPSSWVEVRRNLPITQTSSHWYLDFVLYKNNPTIDALTPPDIGSVLYIDSALVPSSGVIANSDTYFDGSFEGANWTGVAHNSISFAGVLGSYDPLGVSTYGGDRNDSGEIFTDDDLTSEFDDVFIPPVDLFPADTTSLSKAQTVVGFNPPGGLCLSEDVVISNLVLNRLDESGVLWVVTEIEGWHTLPEPDLPDFQRGGDDGSYEARGRYNARVITLSGSFFPASPSQVAAARQKLLQNVNLCHKGSWFATHEPEGTKASRVWLSGQPQISTVNTAGRTDFSIGLKSPDPIKYGLKERTLPGWYTGVARSQNDNVSSSSGRTYVRRYPWSYRAATPGFNDDLLQYGTSINATNSGNTKVYPTMNLTGPTYGPVVIENATTGQKMRVVKNLNPDDNLLIDCYNRSVTLNGRANSRFYLEMILDWIHLDPGSNVITWTDTAAESGGTLTVQWRPGWIG